MTFELGASIGYLQLGVPYVCVLQVSTYYFLLFMYTCMHDSLLLVTDVSTKTQWEPL